MMARAGGGQSVCVCVFWVFSSFPIRLTQARKKSANLIRRTLALQPLQALGCKFAAFGPANSLMQTNLRVVRRRAHRRPAMATSESTATL